MPKKHKLLHCEVVTTENTSTIWTEVLLDLYEKYKDILPLDIKESEPINKEMRGEYE